MSLILTEDEKLYLLAAATTAADAHLKNHPGQAERDELIAEAFLGVSRWILRHEHVPGHRHALALARTALSDYRVKLARPR